MARATEATDMKIMGHDAGGVAGAPLLKYSNGVTGEAGPYPSTAGQPKKMVTLQPIDRGPSLASSTTDFCDMRSTNKYIREGLFRTSDKRPDQRIWAQLCHARDNWEPKDINFQQITDQKFGIGKVKWEELSAAKQVSLIRDALRTRTFLLDPNSAYMKFWDMLLFICLVFTAIVTPFEVAFLQRGFGVLYVISRFVDFIFIKDMMMHFFLKVSRFQGNKEIWIRSRRGLAINYLKSWFIVDFVSILPYDHIEDLTAFSWTSVRNLKLLRLLRVMRLLRLAQVLKATRLAERWRSRITLSSSMIRLLKFATLLLITCHWMGCIWGFAGSVEGTNLSCRHELPVDDPRREIYPSREVFLRDPDGREDAFNPQAWVGMSWTTHFARNRAASTPTNICSPVTLYMISLYWATMTLTSIGYGDILPVTFTEYCLCNVAMLISSCIWAYIIGAVCTIVYTMDMEQSHFDERMDAFNRMAKDNRIPLQLRYRAREYLRASRVHLKYVRSLEVTQSLAVGLRGAIAQHLAMHYLGRIHLFQGTGGHFRQEIATYLKPHFFERQEPIELFGCLCVVERGTVMRAGSIIAQSGYWGEDMILAREDFRRYSSAKGMTHTEILTLERKDLWKALEKHEREELMFRRAAVCLALRRVVHIYNHEKTSGTYNSQWCWVHQLLEKQALKKRGVAFLRPEFRSSSS